MPYKIVKAKNLFLVINKNTGKQKGKHKTRAKAVKHMRALYANEKKVKK